MAGDPPRRRFLEACATAGVLATAGCSALVGREAPTDTPTDTPSDTPTETPTDTPTDTPTETPPRAGGTLELDLAELPYAFDPVRVHEEPNTLVTGRVFEGLYAYDDTVGHLPSLADGYPDVDVGATTWTVTLDDDATFQNGDPVTAGDVVYSFTAPRDEGTDNAGAVGMVDTVEAVDEATVRFELDAPYAPFRHTLHRPIVPEAVRERDRGRFNDAPLGSGPFRFVEQQDDGAVVLERWDDYWGDALPSLEAVVMVPVDDAGDRLDRLERGEADAFESVAPSVWRDAVALDDASVEREPDCSYFYLAFNCKEDPTADRRVREAVDYAVDTDRMFETATDDGRFRQHSPLPRPVAEAWDLPHEEWADVGHDRDLDATAALLEDAGVPRDYDWRIIVPPDDEREQMAVEVAEGLRAAGWENVTVRRLDWGPFLETYVSGNEADYNMYTLGWSGTPDPDTFTYFLLARTPDVLGVTNGTYYGATSQSGRDVSDALVRGRRTADRDERRRLYEDAITTLLEDRVHIPVYNWGRSYAVADHVDGFDVHPYDGMALFGSYTDTTVGD